MRGNNVLGIIFSNSQDQSVSELTAMRTMGSVPFGGRYRMIDFMLSSMVNANIGKVGVVTNVNYQSLMDHIGSGKPWDLSRKREGLFFLPPFGHSGTGMYQSRIEAIKNIMHFIKQSKEEYVVLADCNFACNLDLQKALDYHSESGADITTVYNHGVVPKNISQSLVFNVDQGGRISDIVISPTLSGEMDYSIHTYIMGKALLERLINDAVSRNYNNFAQDILQRNESNLKIMGYRVESFCAPIDSLQSYYDANMALLDPATCSSLFRQDAPVYTKIRDDMPARYGLGSHVKNCLVADGCIIEGEVENCVLFRGVHIGKDARVKNSIIMQDSIIGAGASLNHMIIDKRVTVKQNVSLSGAPTYPVYIGKGIII